MICCRIRRIEYLLKPDRGVSRKNQFRFAAMNEADIARRVIVRRESRLDALSYERLHRLYIVLQVLVVHEFSS